MDGGREGGRERWRQSSNLISHGCVCLPLQSLPCNVPCIVSNKRHCRLDFILFLLLLRHGLHCDHGVVSKRRKGSVDDSGAALSPNVVPRVWQRSVQKGCPPETCTNGTSGIFVFFFPVWTGGRRYLDRSTRHWRGTWVVRKEGLLGGIYGFLLTCFKIQRCGLSYCSLESICCFRLSIKRTGGQSPRIHPSCVAHR
ncbi:hypothetical protein DM02DRAFT_36683 [Periconia macrospinosa]|uniref:Uncharacterized protein n=1 Tax=Periconia macrospinosa TaxID=97972 RepID=A0A2V1EAA7_9PLEO|nr:hypothetical protein DM02DRAFT_36683 [Periconia macrospinosa]